MRAVTAPVGARPLMRLADIANIRRTHRGLAECLSWAALVVVGLCVWVTFR